MLLKGIIGKWPGDTVQGHQLYDHPTSATVAAKPLMLRAQMRKRYWQDAKSKLARKEDQGANLNQGPSAKANVLVISEPNIPTY